MRIAFLGIRGIPANYGGFETFVEELSVRLAARGHEVTVYCRAHHYDERPKTYRGVRLAHLPSIRSKSLDTLSHTALSALHVAAKGADLAYVCNSANACFSWIPRLRMPVMLNTDGLEWERAKWNWAGKAFYRWSARMACRLPIRLVSDSRVIQDYYRRVYGRDSDYVAYGADVVPRGYGAERLADYGVEPGKYVLFVSRLEPENNAHVVVKAFEGVKTDMNLLIVGGAPFAPDYVARLRATKDPRILFPGALYGETYKALQANAYCYVNAMEVGGTHPAILEAMGAGNCVVVSDIAYNTEAVGRAGVTFRNKDAADLREKLQSLVDDPAAVRAHGRRAVARVREAYDWETVADTYETLFHGMAARKRKVVETQQG